MKHAILTTIIVFLSHLPVLHGFEKPCILFLFADDLAYNATGKESGGEVITPELDRLRNEGMYFTQAFNPGSWTPAVCQASRTMLETGRMVWKAQQYNAKKEPNALLWSRMMKQAGYETYFAGKWHVAGLTPTELFDHTGTVRPGMPEQTEAGYSRQFIRGKKDTWRPDDPSFGGYWKGGKHWSEVTADEACDFIRKAEKQDAPFFMYISFNASHDPRQSAKKYLDKYPVSKIRIPASFMPEYPYCREVGAPPKLRDERLAPFPRTEYSIQVNRREYYALTTHLDEQIARITKTLKQHCKRSVYIFFTADQGLSVGDHGFMGKQNLYESSIKVPFIVTGPGIRKGTQVDTPIYLQSAMPTCLEIAGLPRDGQIVFPSLLNTLHGKQKLEEKDVYGAMLQTQRMIRTKEWKMLVYPGAGVVRLYNRVNDPDEMKDVANDAKNLEVMDDLFKRLVNLQKESGDKLDLTKTYTEFVARLQEKS